MDRSATVETDTGRVFIHVFNPPARLIIIGAVHIAEPLARIGAMAGYGIVVVDPRQAFASRGRLEGFAIAIEWPDAALTRLKLDTRTAVVTLTHDPKLDDAALSRRPVFSRLLHWLARQQENPCGPTPSVQAARLLGC
jgi:xanthine dehydrogenase accessory factor